MGSFSKTCFVAFEVVNELYTALGAGFLGMLVLLKHGFDSHQSVKTVSVVALTTASLVFITQQIEKLQASKKKIVVITGCDSGLGFSLAQHTVDMGFTVIAGFLSLESKGSKEIRGTYGGRIIQIQLDITDTVSVRAAVETLEHFFNSEPRIFCISTIWYSHNEYFEIVLALYAIINNAGVMVFGEFEWLTERLIQEQIDVNLLGTFKFTNALCPLLRQSRAALPGLAVYGATKAALSAWSDALRVELEKYGVNVITFIPGSFTTQSNIMGKQLQHVQEMHDSFTVDQHNFYSDYFKRYNVYLSFFQRREVPCKIKDVKLYEIFECTLLDKYPNVVYKHETFRYAFYHTLFKFSPWCLRDYFITKFMCMPQYTPSPSEDKYMDDDEDIDL
ncbi:hypothetical protein NQ314_012864 [Rhamnusium bicolor]|uniref:Estradiol 17-beta-dehydrogenase 2 n=1 Tax=Rhamnusium bicolor TaxID=1586634 RepID=A0AAV8X967_9CUCU|nr:hypothetical protein NQ314_012864 [Rhamnusium bicolor]